MDLLAQLFAAGGTPGPMDDFWYRPVGSMTTSGLRIDAEGAKKLSAWYRGRDLLATSLAMLPLQLYERLPDDEGAKVSENHPLQDALHRKTSVADDAFQWRRQQMFDLIDNGNGYSFINVGRTWTLDRIDPCYVTPERITKGPNAGKWLYHIRDESGVTKTYTRDEVFHLRGAEGKGVLEAARDSLGLSLVTEQYAGRIFSKGFLNGGIIEVPGPMNDESARAMAQSFITAMGEWHMPRVLPQGAKMSANNGLTPDDAQMILSRKFSINDIARWLGLPPHMLADLDRATFSNIEHQGQEFVTYSLGSWLSLFEFAINDQLILQPNRFFAEFTRDALVRGDIAARWQAYQIAVQTGTYTRNEVRRKENMNALDGLDEPLDPAHLTGNQATGQPVKQPAKAPAQIPPDNNAKARAIVHEASARILRKEVTVVSKLAVKHAADGDAFAAAVTDFYAKHAEHVSETLQMALVDAEQYAAGQAAQIVGGDWVAAVNLWQQDAYAAGLAALALEPAA